MTKINLGYWQNSSAREIMVQAWSIVRKTSCTLSMALKQAWKELKDFMNGIATSYKEYKAKLNVKQNNNTKSYIVTIECGSEVNAAEIREELLEAILEKISEVKGKQFYQNMCKGFMSRYDIALERLEQRGSYTFMEGLWCVII